MSHKTLLLLLIPFLLACQLLAPAPTPSPPTPYTLADFTFADPLTQARMTTLDHCLAAFANSPEWRHTPYTAGGNFLRTRWCRGNGAAADCQLAPATQDRRDQHTLELYTLHYQDVRAAFGLGLSARWIPPQTGWGAAFSFAEGGQTVVGEGFSLAFMEYRTQEPPVNQLAFSMNNTYTIGETTLSFPAQHPLRDELHLYLTSPEALLRQGQTILTGLAATVQAALQAQTITTCDYGPYEGNGIPPACTPRPLTTQETQAAQQEAAQYFTHQLEVLEQNYGAMYAALAKTFPFEACWEE